MTHAEAVKKIRTDHRDLQGFSRRNIHRYLPTDNPNIPHRVMTRRHKSSVTVSEIANTSSVTNKETPTENGDYEQNCPNCQILMKQREELEEALESSAGFIHAVNYKPKIQILAIPKTRHTELIEAVKMSVESILVEFDDNERFLSVVPDCYSHNFYGSDKTQTDQK
jgi:hypothetical protein